MVLGSLDAILSQIIRRDESDFPPKESHRGTRQRKIAVGAVWKAFEQCDLGRLGDTTRPLDGGVLCAERRWAPVEFYKDVTLGHERMAVEPNIRVSNGDYDGTHDWHRRL